MNPVQDAVENFWYLKRLKRIKDICFHSCTRRMVGNKYSGGFALILEKYESKCNVAMKVGRKEKTQSVVIEKQCPLIAKNG